MLDFFPKIIESPISDIPRLVLADWLEERNNSPVSKFIRGQIGLATFARNKVYNQQTDVQRRIWTDWVQQFKPFFRKWADDLGFAEKSVLLARGFVSHFRYDCSDDISLLNKSPVESIEINSTFPQFHKLLKSFQEWERLKEVYFCDNIVINPSFHIKWHLKGKRVVVLPWDLFVNCADAVISVGYDLHEFGLKALGWNPPDKKDATDRVGYIMDRHSRFNVLDTVGVSLFQLSECPPLEEYYGYESVVRCPSKS